MNTLSGQLIRHIRQNSDGTFAEGVRREGKDLLLYEKNSFKWHRYTNIRQAINETGHYIDALEFDEKIEVKE